MAGDRNFRILILTSSYPVPQMPNASPFVKVWAQATADAGCEVLVLTMSEDTKFYHYRESKNLEVVAYPYTKIVPPMLHSSAGIVPSLKSSIVARLQLIPYFVVSVYFLCRYVRIWKPHVIEANFLIPSGLIAAVSKQVTRRPLLANAWGTELTLRSSYIYDKLLHFVEQKADKIAIISEDMRRLGRRHGLDASRMVLIPSAVNSEIFRPASRESKNGKIVIGTVKRLIPEKSVDEVIRGVGRLSGRDKEKVRLRIIGDGPEADRLKRLAEEVGVLEITDFVGTVAYEDLVGEYWKMDIGVNPSALEGGTATCNLEMMACGVPVISVNAAGNDEVIVEGETGLFYEFGDYDGLARQLSLLINNPGLRRRISQAGREHVRRNFSVQGVGRLYLDICKELARTADN